MDKSVLSSTLNQGGWTHTPNHIVRLARHVCAWLAGRLDRKGIRAHLIPETPDDLIAQFTCAEGRTTRLRLTTGRAYPRDTEWIYFSSSPHLALTLPDFPEALHFLGIVLEGLGATVSDVGRRDKESNGELVAIPCVPGTSGLGSMDRSDSGYITERTCRSAGDATACILKVGQTFTPVEMFDWACAHAARLRNLLAGPIRVHLCARRDYSRSVRETNFGGPTIELVFNALDSEGRSAMVVFTMGASRKLRDYEVELPNLLQGLHMCGMVIGALRISEIQIGRRGRERNEDVLAAPLKPYADQGRMVNARNFVMPLRE